MPPSKNLIGQKFGRWTVIEKNGSKNGHVHWKCICDCGTTGLVSSRSLTSGNSKSCGCYQKERAKIKSTTHGKSNTRIFIVWNGIKQRTENKNSKAFERYGGRGIEMCEEWKNDFESFYKWSIENGYAEGLTIDRINNNDGYYPENCRWVDAYAQANNKNNNKKITYNGETHGISEWSRIVGISESIICTRIKSGWSIEDVLFKKPNEYGKNRKYYELDGQSKTIKEWSKERNIPYSVLVRRMRSGWNIKLALSTPIGYKTKKVMQYENNGVLVAKYDSASEAAKKNNFNRACITSACLGKSKTYKGFIWSYA